MQVIRSNVRGWRFEIFALLIARMVSLPLLMPIGSRVRLLMNVLLVCVLFKNEAERVANIHSGDLECSPSSGFGFKIKQARLGAVIRADGPLLVDC